MSSSDMICAYCGGGVHWVERAGAWFHDVPYFLPELQTIAREVGDASITDIPGL